MEPDLLKEREKRYAKRKKAKQKFDNAISLSSKGSKEEATFKLAASSKGKTVRLLDEGVVLYGNGEPWFYIKKGVLKSYYDSLQDDYVGSINLGHMDFATFPLLLGQWTKKDLSLVELGDGRYGLDVTLNLDEESFVVKELRRKDYSVGVSAEFSCTIDYESSEMLRLEVLDSVNIKDFAIVGEAGNANSGGIFLSMKGETEMSNIMEKWAKRLGIVKDAEGTPPAEPEVKPVIEPNAGPEDGQKPPAAGQEQEGTVDGKQLTAILESMEEMVEGHEQALAVINAMDKELESKNAEIEEMKKQLAGESGDTGKENDAVTAAMAKFKELTTKYSLSVKDSSKDEGGEGHKDEGSEGYKLSAELSNDGLGDL